MARGGQVVWVGSELLVHGVRVAEGGGRDHPIWMAKFSARLEELTTERLLALLEAIRSCADCLAGWRECEHPSAESVKAVLVEREHVTKGNRER